MTVTVAPATRPVTLAESYARCRQLNRVHGTTYFWATEVLPRVTRHHVHALYGFCRYADELVDAFDDRSPTERAEALDAFGTRFFHDLARGRSDHPVLRAVVHTARAFDLPADAFERFLRSMTMDLTVTSYERYDDLAVYMDGSAAVIGELLLPMLEPTAPEAVEHARELGIAFQLTNFLRDVGEDLDRGRVYLPQEDLRRFGADPAAREVTPAWRDLMRFEIDRTRRSYALADQGIALLPSATAPAIAAARVLYGEILEQIEANDYDVWRSRARVPLRRKLAVAAKMMARRRGVRPGA